MSLFGKKVPVITLTPTHLVAESVSLGRNHKIDRVEFVWKPDTFIQVLTEALSHLETNAFRLLVSDELAYVLTIKIPEEDVSHGSIIKHIRGAVPEDLNLVHWDYQEVFSIDEDRALVQVFVLTQKVQNLLNLASQTVELEVEAIWPFSIALARAGGDTFDSYVVMYADSAVELTAIVYQEAVIFSKSGAQFDDKSELSLLQKKAQETFSVNPSTFILSGVELPESFTSLGQYQFFQQDFYPQLALAKEKKLVGRNKDILNLAIEDGDLGEGNQKEGWYGDVQALLKKKTLLVSVIGILLVVIVATVIGVWVFFFST